MPANEPPVRRGVVLASADRLIDLPPLARDLYVRRIERGMTQADLATAVGCTQPEISEYEHGRRSPSARRLRRLLDVLS